MTSLLLECLDERAQSDSVPARADRRGPTRTLGAIKHSIIVAAWPMLTTSEVYREARGDYFTRLVRSGSPGCRGWRRFDGARSAAWL